MDISKTVKYYREEGAVLHVFCNLGLDKYLVMSYSLIIKTNNLKLKLFEMKNKLQKE